MPSKTYGWVELFDGNLRFANATIKPLIKPHELSNLNIKQKSIDNHQIINAFYCVGMTGFEPATSSPPDDYYKSHYNLDYQYDAYLPFLYGLIHGLNRINRDSSTCYCHHKDNYNRFYHQDYYY